MEDGDRAGGSQQVSWWCKILNRMIVKTTLDNKFSDVFIIRKKVSKSGEKVVIRKQKNASIIQLFAFWPLTKLISLPLVLFDQFGKINFSLYDRPNTIHLLGSRWANKWFMNDKFKSQLWSHCRQTKRKLGFTKLINHRHLRKTQFVVEKRNCFKERACHFHLWGTF